VFPQDHGPKRSDERGAGVNGPCDGRGLSTWTAGSCRGHQCRNRTQPTTATLWPAISQKDVVEKINSSWRVSNIQTLG